MLRGLRVLAFGSLVAACLALLAASYVAVRYWLPGPSASTTEVVIPKGADLADIASLLKAANVISEPWIFRLAARIEGADGSLKAGEYRFVPGVSMRQALAMLHRGETVVRRITVPEGMTSEQVVAMVREAEGLEGEVAAVPAEGALLPETYTYAWGDSRSDILKRMSAKMTAAIEELWSARAEGLPLASPREAVILASVVEKETALPEERPRIAAVFLNRLRLGMKLQADPTVAYALRSKGAPPRPLTLLDLQHASPYNTYVVDALPAGPIANPGRASLQAVLRPASTDELYFVADGNGGHAFARTLEEHNRNVLRWRKLNER